MQLSPPKRVTWNLSLLLALAGVATRLVDVGLGAEASFWLVTAGFVLLALGNILRGL
ncbi:MAG: hypothetical protein HPY83_15130 [Anaerolineae bacterium]|nr:hypothetical protein [Anaerolineae bacterium]